MTAPDLLTPAEVADLFRVDSKTVTRWAKRHKLTSIQTLGGHRRYRAAEVYALLDSERWSGRQAPVTTLIDTHYDGDPERALRDLARRYGIAIAVLDRAWFTQITGRDLTDGEWALITAELAASSDALPEVCAELITHLATASGAAQTSAEPFQPADPDQAVHRPGAADDADSAHPPDTPALRASWTRPGIPAVRGTAPPPDPPRHRPHHPAYHGGHPTVHASRPHRRRPLPRPRDAPASWPFHQESDQERDT